MKIQQTIRTFCLLLLTIVLLSAKPSLKQENITVKKMVQLMDTCKNLKIIDVRSSNKYRLAHIKNALNAEKSEQLFHIVDSLGVAKKYVVYCEKGEKSKQAVKMLLNKYSITSYSLKGGFEQWLRKGMNTYSED